MARHPDRPTAKTRIVIRREKRDPNADLWHTLIIGLPIAAALFFILPIIFV